MRKLSFVFAAAVALAAFGCKKESGGGDCAKAIDNGMSLSKEMMEKAPGMTPEKMQKLKDLGVQHCKDDKWSDDAMKCMVDAKTMGEAQACYGKLSKEQQDKMNAAAMDATPAPAGSAEPSK